MVVPHGHSRTVVRNDVDLPQSGRGSSARANTNFKIAETRKRTSCATTMQGLRMTSQGLFKLSW